MSAEFDAEYKRGSLWHRWDPHIHTPGTVLNNQYKGSKAWDDFLTAIENATPPINALGITDYFGIEQYEEVIKQKSKGKLPNVHLIFPNVELRLSIETSKASAVNLHILFSPEDPDHIEQIKRFLLSLDFSYQGGLYRCNRDDLIRLGRTHQPDVTDDNAAHTVGANQFKVKPEQLKDAWDKNEWVRKNALIAVAGGERDGTSGLRDSTQSFDAYRKNLERMAHIIFSANPRSINFWLGHGSLTSEDLERQYNGCKPCLHGSDAHSVDKTGVPDHDRLCWIKGDLTFETLRQACIEPAERVKIGVEPPKGALDGKTIDSLILTDAPWITGNTIMLNPGLVAVIGARGSGKTALADIIAAGGLAKSARLNEKSFISRAWSHLGNASADLIWTSKEITGGQLSDGETTEEFSESPRVQYLSQQFVDRLCSAEGLTDELIEEIERVIFNAHPISDRFNTESFNELLTFRLEASHQKRKRQQQILAKASEELANERADRDKLKTLQKEFDEKRKAIEKDNQDRKSLIAKGDEDRAKRYEQIAQAVDAKQKHIAKEKRKLYSLRSLHNDVKEFRIQNIPSLWEELKENRKEADLIEDEWDNFKLTYTGDVDALLERKVEETRRQVVQLEGTALSIHPSGQEADISKPLIAVEANLGELNLSLLEAELGRLKNLVGIDKDKAKRFALLTEKIAKEEIGWAKLGQEIERIKNGEARISALSEKRRSAYREIFNSIVEQENELAELYAPIKRRLTEEEGALAKLSFSIRREIDIQRWTKEGEALLDLRMDGPFKGRGELFRIASEGLLDAWTSGDSEKVGAALIEFAKTHEMSLKLHKPKADDFRPWAVKISNWLYSTDHISVSYGLQYDGVNIEQLSPGTRGIVLLLLYLAIDSEDDRPLIIDQPEENLDPQSVFQELVHRFRESRKRRQIIIVTHNANLVVNTDADQVIVAKCGAHRPGQLPEITYECGSLENPRIRQLVCNILEGGERAFRERAKRLRVNTLSL